MSEMELWWGLDTNVSSNDGGKEVSTEDIVRVNESLWEARKYRGKIAGSVTSNSKIAAFISFLFLTIDHDIFRDNLDCFVVVQPVWEPVFLSKVFVACMLPLYPEKADELALDKEFALDYHFSVNFQSYLLYVQQAFAHDNEARKADEKKLKEFLRIVIELWGVPSIETDNYNNQLNIPLG